MTVESAPIAARALHEDRVIEIAGDVERPVPRRVRGPVPGAGAPGVRADGGGRTGGRRDLRRSADARGRARRRRPVPAVDARKGGGAGVGRADRGHPGGDGAPARAADRSRARDPRGRDPAPVRRVDGARRRGRPAERRPQALRERDAGGARGSAHGAAAAAGPRAARDADDVRGRGQAARADAPGAGTDARAGERRPDPARRWSRWPSRSWPRPCATPTSTPIRPGSRSGSSRQRRRVRAGGRQTTASTDASGDAGMGLRLAALEALQAAA